jgi:glutamyl-tRNA reductase
MTINVLGVNHKSAPIDIREKLAFDKNSIPRALDGIKNIEGVNEVVLISTCNRTEIYTENDSDNSKIIKWLNSHQNETQDCEPFMYSYYEEKAIKHLFNVASGVDSMVIGENEILGQVKDAFKIADQNNCIKSSLKKLFEFSFSVAKQVRTKTDIGSNPVSFMFTSITLIKKIFDNISSKKALVVGSGYMIQLAIKYLQSNNVRDITLTNRNSDKGLKIAKDNECNYSKLQYLPNIIASHDIIISCTSSTIPIIGKGMMESSINNINAKPFVIIDLGVPRDVEPEISDLENVYLYSIDDLGKVIKNNYKIREQAVAEAEKIIDYKIKDFKTWLGENHSDNLVKLYRGYVDDITNGAIIKAKKMVHAGESLDDVISYLAESLKNKLTHETTSKLKEILPLLDEPTALKIQNIFKKINDE